MSLAFISDQRFLEHDAPEHPECAARLQAIYRALEHDQELNAQLHHYAPYRASDNDILGVHRHTLLENLEALAASGGGWADRETYVLANSVEIARLAAGASMRAVDAVLGGETKQAFAAIRPPGHHATPTTAMGFCLFNNAAIAADYARREYGIERSVIIDWDVHHGNGTQDIFITDPSVLYISTHGWPLWPGTGHWSEMGEGAGYGATLNIPLPPLTGDMYFHHVFTEIIEPAISAFEPGLIILSAGYDAHLQDPLGPLALSTAGYAHLARIVYNLSTRVCSGRLIGLLEGGYNLDALAYSLVATLRTWLDLPHNAVAHDVSHLPEPDSSPLIERLKQTHPLLVAA